MSKTNNPYLLSNQGVEYFENQNYGKAIAKFYQAKRILPRDSTIRNNLEVLEEEVLLKQPPLLTFNLLNLFEALILLLIFTLIFVFRKIISKRHVIPFGITVLFLSSLLLTAAVALEQKFQIYAAVTEPSSKVYSGTSETNEELFELLDGQIVKVIRREEEWSEIEYDHKVGWIENQYIMKI